MPSSKPACFITYSWDDTDLEDLKYFKYLLERHSNDAFDVLFDRNLKIGTNIDEFTALLDSIDVVIVIMTPSFKRKVMERRGIVYEEYRKIMERYKSLEEEKRKGRVSGDIPGYFILLPVLFSGSFETSVPSELERVNYIELTTLRAVTNKKTGKFVIPTHVERQQLPKIIAIVSSINVISTVKSQDFQQLWKSFFPRLFLELKADWNNPRDDHIRYPETLFVRTNAYRKVEDQSVYFVEGRKGSGKTTVIDHLVIRQREKYIIHVPIIVDFLNLTSIYSLFNPNNVDLPKPNQIQSDTTNVIPPIKWLKCCWYAFLYLCALELLIEIRTGRGRMTAYQKRQLKPIIDYLDTFRGLSSNRLVLDLGAKFEHCFSRIADFFDICVARARPDFFLADINLQFSARGYINYLFGEPVVRAVDTVLSAFPKHKRLLISMDGFDSDFDYFRRASFHGSKELDKRVKFEMDWLRAFAQLVLDNSRNSSNDPLLAKADFCVTVPQDRFYEMSSTERDSYRYVNRLTSLRWSGIELILLLRKRLEQLTQSSTDERRTPQARLEDVFKTYFPHIPVELVFDFNDRSYRMPLFCYVLRHTFWRPRDVLLYYAKILAVCQSLRNKAATRGAVVDAGTLRQAIKDMTKEIIQKEFINEFETTLTNIKEIVLQFTEAPQVLSYELIANILSEVSFRFASNSIIVDKVEDKIKFLFSVGFLGIHLTREMQDRLGLGTRHVFYFNEKERVFEINSKLGLQGYSYIIHPIFCEYLNLNTSGNELIMYYNYDYLHDNEAKNM